MNAVELEHPTGTVLTAYSLGQLSEEALAGIDSHLAGCADCRQVVEGVPPDTLLALLRSSAGDTDEIDPKPAPRPGAVPPLALTDHPRYRVGELLGVGGMGAVYKAEHLLMERPVALKVLNRELIDKPATIERFRREVRAAARLTHPNIVAAFDAEQAGDVHFLAMEYVEGVSLARRSAERGPLPVTEACDYIRQAALGLQHAHECGMVHRDIKPQNLMLTPSGQVKILDFGLARFVIEGRGKMSGECRVASDEKIQEGGAVMEGGQLSSGILHSSPLATRHSPLEPAIASSPCAAILTNTDLFMGTPDYIAPEQARDSHGADIRADIYSLGCTLYDLLAGHAPFPDGNATQKVKAHRERTPAPLRSLRRDVPAELARVVERMMAKEPAARFQTPAGVAKALAPFVAPKALRRKRWVALAGALALVAALVAGVIIYVQTDHGTITVETNDDKIAVMIEKAGGVKIVDKTNNREYLLRPGAQEVPGGAYQIEVSEALAGLDFQTKEFKLRRGQEVRLTAKFAAKGEGKTETTVAPDRKRREERLKILREIASHQETMFQIAKTSFYNLIQAKRDVAKAEVELSESDKERLKVQESLLALAQDLVTHRKAQFAAGVTTQIELLQANAELLEAQTALERAKSKPPTEPGPPLLRPAKAWIMDWGVWIDPDRDCTFSWQTGSPSALNIKIPGNPHILSAETGRTNAPRVLREVEGDFRAEVTVRGAFPSNSYSLVAAKWPFYGSGLLVWQDEKNYIRLERARMHYPNRGWRSFANWLEYYKGEVVHAPATNDELVDAIPTTFRLERTGDTFTASHTQGGKEWTTLPPIKTDLAKKLHVGVTAIQNTPAEYRAVFENLIIVPSKKNPVDGAKGELDGKEKGPLYGGKRARFWLDQLQDANPKFRAEAVQALGNLAQKNAQLIQVLVGVLSDKSNSVGSAAVRAIATLGPDAVPALLEVLKDKKSPILLARAAATIGRIGPQAKAAVPLLVTTLKSTDWGVRASAINALGGIGGDAKTALPAIVEVYGSYLETGPKNLLENLADGGFGNSNNGGFTRLVLQQISNIDPSLVDAVNKHLGDTSFAYGGNSTNQWPRFFTFLKKRYPASTDGSLPSRQTGASPESLMYLGKPASFWSQQRNDAVAPYRAEAVTALGFIAQKHKEFMPALAASLSDNYYEVASAASLALSDLGPQAIPVLSAALDGALKARSADTFRYAANALGLIGPEAKQVVPTLAQALKQNDWGVDKGLHYVSIHALGRIGPAAKPALPAMIDAVGEYLKTTERDGKTGKTSIGLLKNPGVLPRVLVESLKEIDPDVRAVLPKTLYEDGVFREGVSHDWNEWLKLWQETYQALKKRYPGR